MATNPWKETDMSKQTFMDRNPELRTLIAKSDITPAILREMTDKILENYTKYAKELPDTSAWKRGKLDHVQRGADEVREHAALFGLDGKQIDVVTLLVAAHDSGRLIHEHVNHSSKQQLPWRHGVESALLAQQAFGPYVKTPLCLAMYLAIYHHSDVTTPTLEEFGDGKASYALTCLLRDFDKLTGFDDAAKYTADEDFKRKQIETNFSTQRKDDPTWGDEKGKIVPETMLDTFIDGKALVRRDCQSYEAYMAQYVAWIFDIQNDETLELAIKRGGPLTVFNYLLAQTKTGAPEQYARLKAWAETWRGGLLLRS